jgi:AcrR family transcriptional regulator
MYRPVSMGSPERRQTILECASRLFRHYGHAKTGMAEIAREARVSVGSVYLEFPSKEALLEELSKDAHIRVLEAMRAAAAKKARAGFAARLEAVLEARVATFLRVAADGQHACELVHCASTGVRSAREVYGDAERSLYAEMLDEARTEGELTTSIEPKTAAMLVQLAYLGLTPPRLFELPADVAHETARGMCRLILIGLMPRANGASKPRTR